MELLKLGLLKQILLTQNANAVTDPQTLLSQSACFSCFASSPGIMQLLELALLNQIAGVQQVYQGTTDPSIAQSGNTPAYLFLPANVNLPALYTNTTTGGVFTWVVGTQKWI